MSQYALAQIAIAIGISKRGAELRAQRESWPYAEEAVRGGRRRFYKLADLPRDVREAVARAELATTAPATVASATPKPSLPAVREADLTDAQRLERDARTGVLAAIRRFQGMTQCSQQAAMTALLAWAASGQADELTVKMLRLARDPRGRAGNGLPSVRTLKRWLSAERTGTTALAPRAKQADLSVPEWAKVFLAEYQQPQKPSVEKAYEAACRQWGADRPSIHQVRRFLGKLGTVTREAGRMGARELKNIQPFVRRDFSELLPNDIWTGDGHTFDAEVQHPLHGRPFRPEITTFLDIATRRAVAWSVDLAESSWAVADAIRWGIERNGIPALIYVDNGSGYRNAMLKDEVTGLVGRIGATVVHSLPYNSQARGVIERAHQTIWVAGAKMLPSYMGAQMDREARLAQFKLTRRAIKGGGALPLMPWDVFVRFCQERIDAYNAASHRSLRGTSPDLALMNFAAKGWSPERIDASEIDTLFRPRVERTVKRGELLVMNNRYFASDLKEFHDQKVQVAYDLHDPAKVWVYALDGRLICTADVNGNSKHYYPVPVVEQARQKRAQGRLGRVEAKREEILAELHGAPAIAAPATAQIVVAGRVIDPAALERTSTTAHGKDELPAGVARIAPANPAPKTARSERSAAENYLEWRALQEAQARGEPLSDIDARFVVTWPESSQGRSYLKRTG